VRFKSYPTATPPYEIDLRSERHLLYKAYSGATNTNRQSKLAADLRFTRYRSHTPLKIRKICGKTGIDTPLRVYELGNAFRWVLILVLVWFGLVLVGLVWWNVKNLTNVMLLEVQVATHAQMHCC
jgi:hypothetical protein